METKDIVHSLNMLNPDMTVAEAIEFYKEYDSLNTGGTQNGK